MLTTRPWPIRIIRRLARKPVVVLGVCSLGVRLGKDVFHFRGGKIDADELRARVGSHFGAVGGGAVGAMAGAMAGSVFPGVGTLLGGFAGGMLGEMAGSAAGRRGVEWVQGSAFKRRDPDLETPKRSL